VTKIGTGLCRSREGHTASRSSIFWARVILLWRLAPKFGKQAVARDQNKEKVLSFLFAAWQGCKDSKTMLFKYVLGKAMHDRSLAEGHSEVEVM